MGEEYWEGSYLEEVRDGANRIDQAGVWGRAFQAEGGTHIKALLCLVCLKSVRASVGWSRVSKGRKCGRRVSPGPGAWSLWSLGSLCEDFGFHSEW